jgi:hypothetical protein
MEKRSNRDILAAAYRQWHESKASSNRCWLDIVADDVTFGSNAEGELPPSPRHKGKAELDRYFDGLMGDWAMIPLHGA